MPVIPSDRANQGDDSPRVATPEVMHFHSDAVEENELQVIALSGLEEISSPYRFVLELASTNRSLDLPGILKEGAWVSIKQGVRTPGSDERSTVVHRIHGVIAEFCQTGKELEWVKYRAVLVPRLWRMGLAHNSRIFQSKSVPDLVKGIFEEYGLDVDDKLSGDYPTREFIVQYEESDLDFVHRWLEHEGIMYYFTQDEEKETLVLADAPENYGTLPGDHEFRFEPIQDDGSRGEAGDSEAASEDWFKEEVVNILQCEVKQMPKEVILNDYNWRTPADQLECKATVDDDGIGVVYEYNNHYKDLDEGKHLATVRAEEIGCRKFMFAGRSESRGFRAGMVFKLKEPESDDEKARNGLNDDHYQEYLLTEVSHNATQSIALGSGAGSGATYSNHFVAIPKSGMQFRPECKTHWPSIKGAMHARVDGPDDESPYAQIDAAGRYKVKFPLDRQGQSDGSASKWVRKAEAYAGPNQGMHFPLLKGSEVLITYIDGDPDRPVISGAMYNEQTTNIVNEHNHTINRIVTPIGNCVQMDDTVDAPQINIYTTDVKNQIFLDGTVGVEKIEITNNKNIIQIDARSGNEFILFKCDVENTFIRLGSKADGSKPDGIHVTTDGEYNKYVKGDVNTVIDGTKDEKINGDKKNLEIGKSHMITIGDYNIAKLSATASIELGASADAKLSAKLGLTVGASVEIKASATFSASLAISINLKKDKSFEILKDDWNFMCAKKWSTKAVGECKVESLAGKIILDAGLGVELKCGTSSIKMTPTEIEIQGASVALVGTNKAEMTAMNAAKIVSAGSLKLKSVTPAEIN